MGKACAACSALGWVGVGDEASPCSVCNPDGNGKTPALPAPNLNPWVTVAVMDDDDAVRDPTESGQSADAVFSDGEIADYVRREPRG